MAQLSIEEVKTSWTEEELQEAIDRRTGGVTGYDDTAILAAVALNTAKVGITPQQAADIEASKNRVFEGGAYDDTQIKEAIALNTAKVSNVDHPLVEKAVPLNAVFTDTDTVYDDTSLAAAVALNTAKVSNVNHPLVEKAVPSNALFTDTDTVYDDTLIQQAVALNTLKISVPAGGAVGQVLSRTADGYAWVDQIATVSNPAVYGTTITIPNVEVL